MRAKALALAAQGFPVFPVFPGGKIPALPEWQQLATTDPILIEDWWSGTYQVTNKKNKTWIIPTTSNIGIHTADLCVLDVDVKDGTTIGLSSLKTLPPSKTLINRTPTNGLHIIFKLPVGVQVGNKANWIPNVDIRGEHGYIVAPGSHIIPTKENKYTKGSYEWINPGTDIAMISPDLLMRVGTKAVSIQNDFGRDGSEFSDIPDNVPAGGRDDAIYKFCCSWRARNMSREDAMVKLRALFNVIEQPVDDLFSWADAMVKLDQAWLQPAGTQQDQIAAQVMPDLQIQPDAPMTVAQMLIQFVFVTDGSLVADLDNRTVIKLGDFNNAMKPYRVPAANEKTIEMSKLWIISSARQQVFGIEYYPDPSLSIIDQHGIRYFNLYRPADLPVIPFEQCSLPTIQPFLDHLHYLLPDPMHYDLFLNWAAFTIQYPHKRIPWCFLLITSNRGVGKQIIYEMMSKCVGSHNAIQVTKSVLSDNNSFNDFMSRRTLVGFDEIHLQGMDYDKLKVLITANDMEINRKYGTKGKEAVFPNTLAFSNHTDALKVEKGKLSAKGDRRLFVTHCRAACKSPAYYTDLFSRIYDSDMPAHFLSFLNAWDLSTFNHGESPPMTAAEQHMYESTVDDLQTDVDDMIGDAIGPCVFDIVSAQLVYDYLDIGGNYSSGLSKRAIANYLSESAPPEATLKQSQYKVPDVGNKRNISVRCKAIRNAEKWANAGPAAIALEYVRAREAVADTKTRDQIIEDVGRLYKLEEVR